MSAQTLPPVAAVKAPSNGTMALVHTPATRQPAVARAARLVVDEHEGRAYLDGRPIELTGRQLDLLCVMAATPERVVPKAELLRRWWGPRASTSSTRTVDSHAARLRHLLDPAAFVLNSWGRGYQLVQLGQAHLVEFRPSRVLAEHVEDAQQVLAGLQREIAAARATAEALQQVTVAARAAVDAELARLQAVMRNG